MKIGGRTFPRMLRFRQARTQTSADLDPAYANTQPNMWRIINMTMQRHSLQSMHAAIFYGTQKTALLNVKYTDWYEKEQESCYLNGASLYLQNSTFQKTKRKA